MPDHSQLTESKKRKRTTADEQVKAHDEGAKTKRTKKTKTKSDVDASGPTTQKKPSKDLPSEGPKTKFIVFVGKLRPP